MFGHHKVVLSRIDKDHVVVIRCKALGIGFDVALHLPQEADCVVMVDHLRNVLGLGLVLFLDFF